jgi:hypothetical protein
VGLITQAVAGSSVLWESTGPGANGNNLNPGPLNWTHVIGANSKCLIVGMSSANGSDAMGSFNGGNVCKVGTTTMTVLKTVNIDGTTGSSASSWGQMWGLINPPTGSQTISISLTWTGGGGQNAQSMYANSVSYTNVTSLGTAVTNHGSSTAMTTSSITSASNSRAVGVLVGDLSSASSAPNGTSRYNSGTANASYASLMIEDNLGTTNLSATLAPTHAWVCFGVSLNR